MSILSSCNEDRLVRAVQGTLDAVSQAEVEAHLEECAICRERIQQIAAHENDWNKISDYFSTDDYSTSRMAHMPTVDIELNPSGERNRYEIVEEDTVPDHSRILEPATHPEMLGRIGNFSVEQMIGQGGMGIVYKGFDSELNRPVAIKVLAEHLSSVGVARQRFAREARAAAAVIHPNVVPIYSVNSNVRRPYIVMALVPGRSLQAHVQEHGPLPVRDIVRIGKQIAAGLAAAHREGLVHRDIKPANILLESDVSRVMITDFGLARAADDAAITQTGWLAGTPHYMSPEQSSGKEVDHRSDLFSLGSVLYFLATGREPFRADIPVAILKKIVSDDPIAMRSVNNELTSTLCNIIEKLMSKEPEYRFQSADEAESVLTQYLAHLEQPATQPKPKIKVTRKSTIPKHWFLTATTLLILAALLPFWIWSISSGSSRPSDIRSKDIATWPAGLQSPEQWQQDLNSLKTEIQKLEVLQPTTAPFSQSHSDWEQESLEQAIDQLETRLGTN